VRIAASETLTSSSAESMQKYLLLLALTLALTLPAAAQVGRGTKLISASIGKLQHSFYEREDSKTDAALYPAVGWFVGDRVVLGTGALLGYSRVKSVRLPPPYTGRTVELGLLPYARYYPLLKEKHALFAEAGGGFVKSYTRVSSFGEQRFSNERATAHLMLGYNYFLTSNAALELQAGYRRNLVNNLESAIPGELALRVGFSIFLHSPQPEVIKD
jgi:hypothetical protein